MFVVFDIETTGLDRYTHDVIQFAYVMFDERNMKVQAETLYFYYEGMSWTEDAYNIHKISQSFLKQYEADFEKNLVKMFTVLYGANVCGYNNRVFDCPFAAIWLARMGIPNLEYRMIQDCMTEWYPYHHRHKIKLIKLSEMVGLTEQTINNIAKKWFGDSDEMSAHNATYDTTATALLTVQGIAKGYITFDLQFAKANEKKPDIVDSGADKVNELLETPSSGKIRDPKGYAVKLQMSDSPDDFVWHYMTTDKAKYFSDHCTDSELKMLRASGKVQQEVYIASNESNVFYYYGEVKVYRITVGEDCDRHAMARIGSSYFIDFL